MTWTKILEQEVFTENLLVLRWERLLQASQAFLLTEPHPRVNTTSFVTDQCVQAKQSGEWISVVHSGETFHPLPLTWFTWSSRIPELFILSLGKNWFTYQIWFQPEVDNALWGRSLGEILWYLQLHRATKNSHALLSSGGKMERKHPRRRSRKLSRDVVGGRYYLNFLLTSTHSSVRCRTVRAVCKSISEFPIACKECGQVLRVSGC